MNGRTIALLALGVLLVATLAVLVKGVLGPSSNAQSHELKRSAGVADVDSSAANTTRDPAAMDPSSAFEEDVDESGLTDARRAIANVTRECLLTDESGHHIEGAIVTASALSNDVIGTHKDPELTSWLFHLDERNRRIIQESVRVVSDSEGKFNLETLPDAASAAGSAVWVTHSEHEPIMLVLSKEEGLDALPSTIQMTSSQRHVARVIDGNGSPVAGAQVLQQAGFGVNEVPSLFEDPRQYRRALLREFKTDPNGEVVLHSMAGPQYLSAIGPNGRKSDVRYVSEDTNLELVVHRTLSISGSVRSRDGASLGPWAMVVVSGWDKAHERWNQLAAAPATEREGFGPVTIASSPVHTKYEAHLVAGDNVRESRPFSAPSDSNNVRVDFEFEAGTRRWFFVYDESKASLPNDQSAIGAARIALEWQSEPDQPGGLVALTTDSGFVEIQGLPAGTPIDGHVEAAGFARHEIIDLYCEGPSADSPPLTIAMQEAASSSGRVVHDGEPVRTYELLLYDPRDTESQREIAVIDSIDGSFKIDDRARVQSMVIAYADGIGTSAAVQLPESDEGLHPFEIELINDQLAFGQALNARTLDPIAGLAHPVVVDGAGRALIAMDGVPLDAEGRFEVRCAGPSGVAVTVVADEFENNSLVAPSSAGPIDLGTVWMQLRGQLELQLLDCGEVDLTRFSFYANGEPRGSKRHFDRSGRLTRNFYSGIQGGFLVDPDGVNQYCALELLDEPPWQVNLSVGASNPITVEFVNSNGSPQEVASAWLHGSWRDAGRRKNSKTLAIGEAVSSVLFAGPDSGDVRFELSLPESRHSVVAVVQPDGVRTVTFNVGSDGAYFRLVDESQNAVHPGTAWGVVDLSIGSDAWSIGLDPNGEFDISARAARSELIYFMLGSGAFASSKPPPPGMPSSIDEPHELVFVAPHWLDLDIRSADKALSGVGASVFDPTKSIFLAGAQSDSVGHVRFGPAGPGNYVVQVSERGFLPAAIEVSAPSAPIEIELERLVPAVFTVRDLNGLRVSGASIELAHDGLDESFADWVARGWIRDVEVETSSDGTLEFPHVPTGYYLATVSLGDRWTEQRIEVSSDGDNEFLLTLGD